jgi:4-amino-4-deoxy-L-arabinose transferase-like glycosyltransferase
VVQQGFQASLASIPASRTRGYSGALLAAALCFAHLVFWGTSFSLAFEAPRLDGAEQLLWAYPLEAGYWKHPPLPSWIMHGLVNAFGASSALTYVAGQASIALALGIAWRLGCEFMDARRSLAALALTSLVYFYNAGGEAFNHELALLPWLALGALLFLHAVRSGRWTLWALAGAVAGLAMLTKYAAALHFISMGAWCLIDSRRRTARNFLGMALAAVVAAAVFAPHFAWLVRHDFQPIRYASAVIESHNGNRIEGLLTLLAGVAVYLLPLIIVARLALGGATSPKEPIQAVVADRSFLWILGCLPFALTLAIGLAAGTHPPLRWATSGVLYAGWLVMDAWRWTLDGARLRRLLLSAAAMQVAICIGALFVAPYFSRSHHAPSRTNFPGAALAEAAQASWQESATTPLRLVVGDIWTSGNIVAHWKGSPPAVLVDAMPDRAPWIPADAIRRCGALIVLDTSPDAGSDPHVQAALQALLDQADFVDDWELPWPGEEQPPEGRLRSWIRWGVILPQGHATCPL